MLFRSVAGSDVKLPPDLAQHLPYLLWLYQMGIVLFWIYDRSARQSRTQRLLEQTSSLVARAIKISRYRILKPLRDAAIHSLESIGG